MNDRIEELAAIAKKQAQELKAHKMIPGLFAQSDYNRIFGDLILKECETALRPMLRDMISRGKAVELIKEHFGVK